MNKIETQRERERERENKALYYVIWKNIHQEGWFWLLQ